MANPTPVGSTPETWPAGMPRGPTGPGAVVGKSETIVDTSKALARIGADIGGTFTDVVLEIGEDVHSSKILTTPQAPEQAVLEGIETVVGLAGIGMGDIAEIIHGTTLATNAVIERRGARTALITTKGFRDVIEMRTENRFEQYDLNITLPKPLVARSDRYVVGERISAEGEILLPLVAEEVERLAGEIAAKGYESVAVGLIHSYVNGVHERQIREILQRRIPSISISISSEVSPQIREFERFCTVCANAYVKPVMAAYLGRLASRLEKAGAHCPLYLMHSGGGIITVESAVEFPVRLLESGPAGGAIFAAEIAKRYGIPSVVSYDMGGTTAKICLIENQTPKTAKTFEVARTYRFKKGSGMPISIPVIEMVEIGAGGGSIASIDSMRQIRVGPESAGSEPGPACYQRGGDRPTVTDADLLLGRLDPANFAGGNITLSIEKSADAAVRHVGSALAMDAEQAAFGICEVVDENMANAARVHAVENGKDIANFTVIAFGGAAPLHAARFCDKLGIRRFLVPPGAGVGSAIGFLWAPFSFEAVRSSYVRLSGFDAAKVNAILDDLTAEAASFVRAGGSGETLDQGRYAYMRYVGQGWEIPVAIPPHRFGPDDARLIQDWFEAAYAQFFGRPIDGLDIEIVSWSVKATSPLRPVERVAELRAGKKAKSVGRRRLFDVRSQTFVDADVFARSQLRPGMGIAGPAVIVEAETSIVLPPDHEAVMQADGCILVEAGTASNDR